MEVSARGGPGRPARSIGSDPIRLLMVLRFPPRRDLTHGGRVIAQMLFELTKRHRVALVYVRYPDSRPLDPMLAERCELVEEVPRRSGGEPAWRRRLQVIASPLSGIPSAVWPQRERGLSAAAVSVAERWQPDVIQVEDDTIAYLGPALERSGSRASRVIVCHDPGLFASADQGRASVGRRRLAHRMDARAWRRYWRRTLPSFDAVVTFTDQDQELVSSTVSGPRFSTIGIGIDVPAARLSAVGGDPPQVAYVGSFKHPPNTDAALRLLYSIMPAVRRQLPGIGLVVVGKNPGPKLIAAATGLDTITGTVASVEPFVDQATLLALPIRLGGGMRVKLLEALAAGKPVVASPRAAAGLGVRDGDQLLLADTDEEFVEAIVRLVGDEDARRSIGAEARRWVTENLSWEVRAGQYERLYRLLLEDGTR